MMTMDQIMTFRWAEPFRPFTIVLKDGRSYTVSNPSFMAIGDDGIALSDPFAIILLEEIEGLMAKDGSGDI